MGQQEHRQLLHKAVWDRKWFVGRVQPFSWSHVLWQQASTRRAKEAASGPVNVETGSFRFPGWQIACRIQGLRRKRGWPPDDYD